MPLFYVHLSDIHFGQEKGGQVVINNDVKDEIIRDSRKILRDLDASANGIIISGDIAYAGTESEYKTAGAWLDRLAAGVGCDRTEVQVVPGNHDIDLSKISNASQMLVDDILSNGDTALNKYLANDLDREVLYEKFAAYRIFSEAYDCPLDSDGNVLNHRLVEITSGKWLKFHGVNTALLCSKNKTEEGRLMLGQRQRVIPNADNVEIIVIAHHPMNWLQDSEDAFKYIKNRSRVFITGHEHKPSHKTEEVEDGVHFLSIASGAAVPPKANEDYTYCYNILEFAWDKNEEKLSVKVYPRRWDDEHKKFAQDDKNFAMDECKYLLKCPNFDSKKTGFAATEKETIVDSHITGISDFVVAVENAQTMAENQDQVLLLKFFRELSSSQRLTALVELQILTDTSEPITHTVETRAVRALLANGRAEELKNTIDLILSTKLDKND